MKRRMGRATRQPPPLKEHLQTTFPPPSRCWTVLAASFIVLAAVAAYHNSFAGVFAYDDQDAIVENITIRHLWPLWPVLVPPHSGETVSGRPLLNLSLAINYAISGLNVWSYHATNLLIHIAAAVLLFGILRQTFLTPLLRARFGRAATALALASTLVWTLHPLQTESVTYIVQRAESLAGLFYLLTLYSVIRGAGTVPFFVASKPTSLTTVSGEKGDCPPRSCSWLWYAAAVLACLLGTACKEILVSAPLIVLLYDRTFLAGSFVEALRRRWGLYVGLATAWALLAYLVLSTGLIARQPELGAPDPFSYARSQPGVILHYLRLSVWLSPLCMSYEWPVAKTLTETLPGAVALALLGAATVWGLTGRRVSGFLGGWFFLVLAPTSSILPLNQLVHEHRMYLPLAALAVLMVAGGYALWDRLLPEPEESSHGALLARWAAPVAGLAAVLALLGSVTVARNSDYHSPLAIWRDGVNKNPHNPMAHNNLGIALAELGKTDEAIEHYQEALRLNLNYPDAHNNLGILLATSGQTDEAIRHYREALRLRPDFATAHNNLGLGLAELGRTDEAIRHYEEALRLKPDDADAHYNLGIALAAAGRGSQAIQHYRRALQLSPQYVKVHNNLANALARLGRTDEAMEHYQEALRLNRDDAVAHNNLGNLLAGLGRANEAIEHYRQSLRLKPDFVLAHYDLARVLNDLGRTKDAVASYHKLLELAPDSLEALNSLAWLLATHEPTAGGDAARAVELAKRARELGGQANAQCLDTLAAAYAAAGRFDDAVVSARQAIQLAESAGQTALARRIQARLELYRAGRPYRANTP